MNSETIKIAVCDDFPEDRQKIVSILSSYLDENNIYAEIDEFSCGEDFLKSDTSVYLLVFLDIFMPGINGMEIAKNLIKANNRVQIVFNSTSSDFAAEAFNISALHYLVKPVKEEKYIAVLDKFFEHYYTVRTVTVKVNRIEEDIYLSDLLYVEAKGRKTILHTKHGKIESSTSLSDLINLLPKSDFCCPIRWALVSIHEIVGIPTDAVTLSDGSVIPISRGSKETIKQAVANYKWKKMRVRLGGR